MGQQILIVDDQGARRAELVRLVEGLDCEPVASSSAADAITRLGEVHFDLCIVDLGLPAEEGTAVIMKAHTCRPPVVAVALTTHGAGVGAVEALRAGAAEIVAKPVCPAGLAALLRRLMARASARRPVSGAAVIGDHPRMQQLLDRVDQIADTDAAVLIRGETGTGKEVIARLIHGASARRGGPFIAVNLAALPGPLAEAELFGQVGGAFTDVDRPRAGRLVAAHGGTLFLDEIGEMPRSVQAQLLRVLQERAVTPIGGGGTAVPIDLRVIAATHQNLDGLIAAGRFREDLYYHLDVVPIEIPPLRARSEDIPALAEHFRGEVNAREGRSVPGFALDVMRRFSHYAWPGNVRELENLVERLVVLAGTRMVVMDDLPAHLRTRVVDLEHALADLPVGGVDLRVFLTELEERFIAEALERTGGNRCRAADLLGINRSTLSEKLRRRIVA
jgi:two-component system, NtrC family, response regulator AtoC